VAIVGGLIYLIVSSSGPADGADQWEVVPTQEALHIDGTDGSHEPYNTDPPTSGAHYGNPMTPLAAGFYDTAIPDENLVHSLEHGYVIIWYDCAQFSEVGCTNAKNVIKSVISSVGTYKVIGVPRENMQTPIALTSWGRLFRLSDANQPQMLAFVKNNREKSPEPAAP
jgi:hypothetical protein